MKTLLVSIFLLSILFSANSQSCSPQGNQTSYGTNNTWRGYVYDNSNFTSYKGYVTEGNSSSPNFDEDFGGSNVSYSTNGCPVNTSTFSVRYKLTKTFTNGNYDFTVGGDDGYRLSLDGGSTWVINKWYDQSYSVTSYAAQLNGTYNMVLEYYENGGDNRISFNVTEGCSGSENTNVYGTNNVWKAYLYTGTNFNQYKGFFNRGNTSDASFDESFGGSNTIFTTSCSYITTENFSVRFRLTKTFANSSYTFFVGGDDGYRLSLDGGNTWVINNWSDHSYTTSSYTVSLNGTYNLVLEYYENGGDNRVNFNISAGIPLPVKLISFSGKEVNGNAILDWTLAEGSNPDYFEVERSSDGVDFITIDKVYSPSAYLQADMDFKYDDKKTPAGKSFYRIKMVDQNGVVTYSKTVSVTVNKIVKKEIAVFPSITTSNNPVKIQSNSTLNSAAVVISTSGGVTVNKKVIGRVQAGQTVDLSLNSFNLSKGLYYIQVIDNNQIVDTKKIIVQ